MEKEQIISIINEFLVEDFEVEEQLIKPESNLKDTLDLDSLDYVDLVVSIESHFGFKVKAEDFATMITINDFYEYVSNKVQEKAIA